MSGIVVLVLTAMLALTFLTYSRAEACLQPAG